MAAFTIRILLLVFFLACFASSGWAGQKPDLPPGARAAGQPGASEPVCNDPLGRDTPQGTVFGFMKSATQKEYEQAVKYLDTKMSGIGTHKLIAALEFVLDRGFSGKLGLLSNKPEGYPDDNLPPSKERVGTFRTESGSFDIVLERVQRGKDPPVWLFSAETLKKLPEVYGELDVQILDAYLPSVLTTTWFLWLPLWRWFSILLVIPLSFGFATLATRFASFLLLSLTRRKGLQGEHPVMKLTGPVRMVVFSFVIWSISAISHSIVTSVFWTYVASTLTVIGLTWFSVRVLDVVFELKQIQMRALSPGRIPGRISIVQLLEKLSKIVVLIVGTFILFYIAGINITAALTGLGIGGIAIAFAAQKTLENLFGGIMIISDQPIRVGDFCRAGEHIGTVENIGLRSTRLRTLKRTVVSVPNGQLAVMSLENFSTRDKILFQHNLQLRYETTADQLRYILAEIRNVLLGHPKVESPSARVRFIEYGDSSLDLEVFAYVLETSYESYLPIQEDLLLRIMDIVEKAGSGFAFPSQTTYLAVDTRLDASKRALSELGSRLGFEPDGGGRPTKT
jgi:MscS family membrane protein